MTAQNFDHGNIIESMDQAFGNCGFYGLEYVLDEWVEPAPPLGPQNIIDAFGFWDCRD